MPQSVSNTIWGFYVIYVYVYIHIDAAYMHYDHVYAKALLYLDIKFVHVYSM